MRDIFILLVLLISVPIILRRPFYGVLVWCWISYMVPHRQAFGFIQTMPVSAVTGLVLLAGYLFSKEPKKVPMETPIKFLLLFNLWMCITYFVNPATAYAAQQFEKVMTIQIFTLIILAMLTTLRRIELALWVVALSIGFYGFKGGLYTLQTGGGGRVWGPIGGFFNGNNELAISLLIIFPILFYLRSRLPTHWIWAKRGMLLLMGFIILSVLGSQSRGALLGTLAVATFLWLKGPNKMGFLLVFILAAPLAYNFMPQSWHERMGTIVVDESKGEQYDTSVSGRFDAWHMAFNLAKSEVFGGGYNAFNASNYLKYAPFAPEFQDSHSIYFQIMAHHGFIGFFLWFMIYFTCWKSANQVIRLCDHKAEYAHHALLAKMLQCSLIAYAVGGAFLGLGYFDLPFHIVISIVALLVVTRRQLQAEAAQSLQDTKA